MVHVAKIYAAKRKFLMRKIKIEHNVDIVSNSLFGEEVFLIFQFNWQKRA